MPGCHAHVFNMVKLLVWYDGACPLCRREIALMRKLDQKHAITFLDVALDDTVCPIDRAELLTRFHAFEDGQILSGAAAFAAMWRSIPLLRPVGLAARNRFVLGILDGLYRAFLHARPRFQSMARWLEKRRAS